MLNDWCAYQLWNAKFSANNFFWKDNPKVFWAKLAANISIYMSVTFAWIHVQLKIIIKNIQFNIFFIFQNFKTSCIRKLENKVINFI